MEENFLEFQDVSFAYPPVEGEEELEENQEPKFIYDHFSATLPSGFVSLVGPNGSGKSTLMLLASGRICPTYGNVNLYGINTREFFPIIRITETNEGPIKEIAPARRNEEEKNKLASVIYQNMEFDTEENVNELLSTVYKNGTFNGKGKDELFKELISVLELEKVLDKPLSGISKGEMQRTLLAFSILYGSKSIFMDEPLFAMEYCHKEKALEFLTKYSKENNVTIYISMHELELTKRFSPTVLLFYPDRNMDLGTPEEVLTDEALEKAYGIPASQLRNTERLTRNNLEEAARVEKEMEDKLKENNL